MSVNPMPTQPRLSPTPAQERGIDGVAYDTRKVSRPTVTYLDFDRAYQFLNAELFDGKLPPCLITLHATRDAYGHFAAERFANIASKGEVVDEIALNPAYFAGRTLVQILSVLAHEMVHLWQHHFGKPGRGRYHNREWAREMNRIGLGPSDTSEPGGKPTGERVSHYIRDGGPFEGACRAFLSSNSALLYQDLWHPPQDDEAAARSRAQKTASKTRYQCPACRARAWAKPGLRFTHIDCDEEMICAAAD